jgi:hypothetical protein
MGLIVPPLGGWMVVLSVPPLLNVSVVAFEEL